jgi:hypothetical protein
MSSFDERTLPAGITVGDVVRTFQLRHPYPYRYWRNTEPISFEATTLNHETGAAGFLLEYSLPGERMERVGWFPFPENADRPEWHAWTWLVESGGPPAPTKAAEPRRGLLWHVISAAKAWYNHGY